MGEPEEKALLEVWRVRVKKSLLQKAGGFSVCEHGNCGKDDFGWNYTDFQTSFPETLYSLPKISRPDQWKDLCMERAVTKQCIATVKSSDVQSADEVAATFQRDVL